MPKHRCTLQCILTIFASSHPLEIPFLSLPPGPYTKTCDYVIFLIKNPTSLLLTILYDNTRFLKLPLPCTLTVRLVKIHF